MKALMDPYFWSFSETTLMRNPEGRGGEGKIKINQTVRNDASKCMENFF